MDRKIKAKGEKKDAKSSAAASQTSETLKKSIQGRLEAEKRAYDTVLTLIDGRVSEEVLVQAARFLDPGRYEDVVTERALAKLCGYPLCSNDLPTPKSQKYHIDATTKQVFDISQRKNYCSSGCYAASVLYEKQLSLTPVWLRVGEVPTEVQVVISNNIRGLKGIAVQITEEISSLADEIRKMDMEEKKQQTSVDSVQ